MNPWNDPNSPYFIRNCNVAVMLDALHSLIRFTVADYEVGPEFNDFMFWFGMAEKAGLISRDEYSMLYKELDHAAYRRTCRK